MKQLASWLSALALACAPSIAQAQSLAGTPIKAPASFLPGVATYCDDGTGHAVICASGGGSGGAATPTGTAGSPTASVVSVQGVAGGVAIDTVVRSSGIDRSAVVGTTAITLMPANATRRAILYQVQPSTGGDCYISGLATATADQHSYMIQSGQTYETPAHRVGVGAISIICTVAGTLVHAVEY